MAQLSLDTNVLVYAIDPTERAKHERAKALVRRSAEVGSVLTHQVLGEYLNVLRKRRPESHDEALASARQLSLTFLLLATPAAALLEAHARAVRYQLQYWDALIVTVCLASGVTHLLTEDLQDGQKMDGITVIDPFNPANAAKLDGLFDEAEQA